MGEVQTYSRANAFQWLVHVQSSEAACKLEVLNDRKNITLDDHLIFLWSAPVAFRRVALETPEWTSRDSNHHRQSVSAGKTNAIPTEPSGRLTLDDHLRLEATAR